MRRTGESNTLLLADDRPIGKSSEGERGELEGEGGGRVGVQH